jgi:hypothetical protein
MVKSAMSYTNGWYSRIYYTLRGMVKSAVLPIKMVKSTMLAIKCYMALQECNGAARYLLINTPSLTIYTKANRYMTWETQLILNIPLQN